MDVKKVVIVGGGSAGWMTASTLIKSLPNIKVTLVESPTISKIGVGESTLAGLPAWLFALGIDVNKFMKETDASYKLSIRFEDFHHIGDGGFHYPFGHPTLENCHLPGANDWHVLKKYYPETTTQSYVQALFPQSVLLDSNKMMDPEKGELGQFTLKRDFALQFDAIKFADWLAREFAKPLGVEHILANVTDVIQNENGIKSIILEDGTEVEGDLFVDCTGFKSMLISGALNEPFLSAADVLPVNSTWAVQLQYEDPEKEVENYTNCTALGHGWVWNAPLYSRIGTGYVYSNRWTTKEAALEEFKQYIVKTKGAHRLPPDEAFREVPFRSGTFERTWVKNVVAMGLAGMFLEPLESNGLYFIHENAVMLSRFLERGYVNGIDRDFYNGTTRSHFESFKAFIKYHYCLSSRRDTEFWKYMTEESIAPNAHEFSPTHVHAEALVNKTQNQSNRVSMDSGFHAIAVGLEWYPISSLSIPYWNHLSKHDYLQIADEFLSKTKSSQRKWQKAIENAPSHYQYLKQKFHSGE